MNTVKLPPEGPKDWVLRTIDKAKEAKLATRVIGGVAVMFTSFGAISVLGEAAKDFNESHRETNCRTVSAVMESDFVDGIPYLKLSGESKDEINRFLKWQPGGYQAEEISVNVLAYDPDTGTVAPGETEVQICVTDAPLSGSDLSVSRVESTDPKRMSGPLA